MIKKLFLVLLLFNYLPVSAQTIKTDILVIGGNAAGTAAAIQGARSKLKTLLVEPGAQLCAAMASQTMASIRNGKELPSGIWGEFSKRVAEYYKTTPGNNTALKLEPYTGATIIRKIADTVKNLTIKLNAPVTGIKKDGTGWEVTIRINGENQLIKAKVLVDASPGAVATEKYNTGFVPYNPGGVQSAEAYRTSITVGDYFPAKGDDNKAGFAAVYPRLPVYCIPINAIIAKGSDNLLIASRLFPEDDLQYLPAQLTLGQGAGTVAAFCAFFKTSTKNLNVRLIQGELLDFSGYLIPFADINQSDPYFRSIQQIGATGLLKGVQNTTSGTAQLLFMPDSVVNTAEIEPVLNDIYTRTFLWFGREKPAARFTVGNVLSLISEITLTDPKTLQLSLAKTWKTEYKFKADFNMGRPVTRREFAVLINKFLNPFSRTVNLAGRYVN